MRGDSLYPDVSGPIAGFLYLPGFAVAFMPFDWLGPWIGDAVWKATGLVLLTYAAWSSCREMHRDIRVRVLSVAFALSIPLLAGSFLNGQSNIHLAAACWLMTLSAFREKTTGVLFWTGAAILAKPLAIVMILLIACLRPRMIPALASGIVWAIGLPLIAADGQYLLSLYRDCWKMLTTMAVSERFATADFTAVISRLGWSLDLGLIAIIRCIAACLGDCALDLISTTSKCRGSGSHDHRCKLHVLVQSACGRFDLFNLGAALRDGDRRLSTKGAPEFVGHGGSDHGRGRQQRNLNRDTQSDQILV